MELNEEEFMNHIYKSSILISGSSGFIGSNLILKIMNTYRDIHIIGIDNMNDYYDVSLKEYRLKQIEEKSKKTM